MAPITCNQLCRLRRCNIFGRLLLKNSSMWCGQHFLLYCSGVHAVSAHVLLSVFPFSALHRLRCVFGKPIPRNNGHSLGFTHVHGNSDSALCLLLLGTTSTTSPHGCVQLWVGLASLPSLPVVFSSMKKCCSPAMPCCFLLLAPCACSLLATTTATDRRYFYGSKHCNSSELVRIRCISGIGLHSSLVKLPTATRLMQLNAFFF